MHETVGRTKFFALVLVLLAAWVFLFPFLHPYLAALLTLLGVGLIWYFGQQRLEDAGFSRHYIYLNFVPFLGSLAFLGLCLHPSNPDYIGKDIDDHTMSEINTAIGFKECGDPASAIYALLSISKNKPEATAECAKQISFCFAELGELDNAKKYIDILERYGDLKPSDIRKMQADIIDISNNVNSNSSG